MFLLWQASLWAERRLPASSFLNLLTLAKTRRELEQTLDFSPFKEQFWKHLLWGWGSRHLWVKQRCPYNGSVAENLKV